MANFKKLAKNYEKTGVLALQEMVHRPSVYDEKTIEKGAPYGKGVKEALDYLASLAKSYGFAVDTCDGYATEISYGEEGPLIGIYAHSDVVPVSGKWNNPPFGGKIIGEGKEAKMIGRGTSDDKGPLIASLMAIKLLKDNGLIKGYRVRLVSGGDEERGSSCLEHYFGALKKPHCDYGFTPDASFPLIYAEKAISRANASKMIDLSPVLAMDGGTVANAVCDRLVVTLPSDKKFAAFLKEKGYDFDVSTAGSIDIVTFKGKSAHGSTPSFGVNAAGKAFEALGAFYKNEFLSKLATVIFDPTGKTFGGDSYSPDFGKEGNSSFNYGVVKYDSRKVLTISIDHRYGEKGDKDKSFKAFSEATGMNVNVMGESRLLHFDQKSPLVSTLMKSYKRMTHKFFDKPIAIGGGTYAKEAKNCVAYGSAFAGREGDIHSPNEYIYLEDFYKQIAIYADAIYSLGTIKK